MRQSEWLPAIKDDEKYPSTLWMIVPGDDTGLRKGESYRFTVLYFGEKPDPVSIITKIR